MSINMTIRKPVGLCEKGRRVNNEDSMYPTLDEGTVEERLFIVCDGVGGAAKGNVASKIACETFSNLFQKATISDPHFVESALKKVEDRFQEYTENNPNATGMGTTLTLLHFHNNGATVAHIGDSRIYQIREGQILYRSEDHSYVQDLVKSGIISPEQARTHPKRNVITRAIQGNLHRTQADTYMIQDIQAGDYFFLCSDGILESITDNQLCMLLTEPMDNKQKIKQIDKLCATQSRDNYTCYLIEIEECTGSVDDESVAHPPSFMPSGVFFNKANLMNAPSSIVEIDNRDDPVTLITPIQSSRFKQAESKPTLQTNIEKKENPPIQQANYWLWILIGGLVGFIIYKVIVYILGV